MVFYCIALANHTLTFVILCFPRTSSALVGLESLVSAKVKLISIMGGNQQVIKSAFQQAQRNSARDCNGNKPIVRHERAKVATVISGLNKMELFTDSTDSLGRFDVVVLAAPLQQSQINFLVESVKDASVLQEMPFRTIDVEDDHLQHTAPDGEMPLMAHPLPSTATSPYTQVVTTLVGNAVLNTTFFQIDDNDLPRGIYTTEYGKGLVFNITAIAQITPNGVYKVFSSEVLQDSVLSMLFGAEYRIEFLKVWGGPHGGATPNYAGGGFDLVGYLLYDGGVGVKGHTEGAALYYPNTIEGSMACMELSAIGAKSVAKLVAKRLRMVEPWTGVDGNGDEL